MQSRLQVFHAFTEQLDELAPEVRITRLRGLALMVLGVAWAGSVSLPRVAAAVPIPAHPASTERRFRRWLANEGITMATLWSPLRRALLAGYRGEEIVLVFDPTPFRGEHSVLCLGIVHGHRVLPLAWRLEPLKSAWPESLATVLGELFGEVAADLPPDCTVTLLADRGFVGPGILDACTQVGWKIVLRLRAGEQESTRVRLPDGTEIPLPTLLSGPGQRWDGPVAIFKKAGWHSGYATIYWPCQYDEPWVLFSTRPGGLARVREDKQRARVEATYQDLKSRGFRIESSRVRQVARLERLLLVVTLALWWLHALGDQSVKRGLRPLWERPDRHEHSRIQLGWRFLRWCEEQQRAPPLLYRKRHRGRNTDGHRESVRK